MKIKAAVLIQTNQPLEIEELTPPTLQKGQALVKIAFSGVCHSQLNEVRGKKGEDRFLPHTLGHEASGIVEEVGPVTTKVKAGDTVVLTWIKGEGQDVPSAIYTRNDGSRVNSGAISTFMDFAVISENRLVPVSANIPLQELPLLGCSIPTGAGIILNTAKVKAQSSVAVFGVGGIGLSAVIGATLAKASSIIAVDVLDHKLSLARSLGATHVVNGAKQDSLKSILELTNNRGVDYAIEASGKSSVMEMAFRSVRDGGGLCVLAGNLPAGETISIDPFNLIKGKKIIGTWGGETKPDEDIRRYTDWYQAGELKLKPLITNIYSLSSINQALNDLEDGKIGRGIIDMSLNP